MSDIYKFIEKIKTDSGLQTKLGELAQQKADMAMFSSVATEYGFTFNSEDWAAYAKARFVSAGVSNERLTSVAGGAESTDTYSCSWWCVAKLLEVEGVQNDKVTYSCHPGCW